MTSKHLSRRHFLRIIGVASASSLAAACGAEDEVEDGSDTTLDAANDVTDDIGRTDAGDVGDAATDIALDSGDIEDAEGSDAASDVIEDAGNDVITVTPDLNRGPWVSVSGTSVVLRFENRDDGASRTVVLVDADGNETSAETVIISSEELIYEFPPEPIRSADRDSPGVWAMHEARFEELVAGARYTWRVTGTDDVLHEGTFRAPPEAGAFRVLWVADTMRPVSEQVAALAAAEAIDLHIHGGDIQYQSNPTDTWNGYFAAWAPIHRKAPSHFIIGNHEYEELDEFEVQYARMLFGQGDTINEQSSADYHAFSYGGVRFVCMNSEAEDFDVAEGAQLAWLRAELAAARENEAIRRIVVAFHRPYYSFSRNAVRMSHRLALHPIFVEYGVDLVLCGHQHSYERFEVDGIPYVVDGGGGAGLYNPNEALEEIEVERPEEIALRLVVEKSHGYLTIDVDDAGAMTVVRTNLTGNETDRFVIGA